MKKIKLYFLLILFVPTILWFATNTFFVEPLTYFSFRKVFVQYSGVLAISLMSVIMVLALRPKIIEPYLDGMDKVYKLHKYLGIAAFIIGLTHWWWAKGTKWMVGWGWLEKPIKSGSSNHMGVIEAWFRTQKGFAETVGEWAFYIMIILIFITLIKKIPYHWFAKTHKLFALVYLALVYHTIILTNISYWQEPIGWMLAILLLAGTVASIITLSGNIGFNRKVTAEIVNILEYPALNMLKTTLLLENGWSGHKAGQFAFVTSNKKEGAHPYTIASAWNENDKKLVFITKALGDHTSRLKDILKIGSKVVVEGPYGNFNFEDKKSLHIYIGAGIGVTPFIARMQELSDKNEDRIIHFFYATSNPDEIAIEKLIEYAKNANVILHIFDSKKDGRMNKNKIKEIVENWQNASFWFCGPTDFGQELKDNFVKDGLKPSNFHQELFEMR